MAFLRTYVSILAALFAIVAAGVFLSDYWTETIAAEERPSPTGNAGFSLEQYRWPKTGLKITLYAEPAMRLTYRIPYRHSLELIQARWLPDNRALLLQLQWYLKLDSTGLYEEGILFYDFDRASLQTHSPSGAFGGESLDEATAQKEKDGLLRAVQEKQREPKRTAR